MSCVPVSHYIVTIVVVYFVAMWCGFLIGRNHPKDKD
jgi:hypothetical protein